MKNETPQNKRKKGILFKERKGFGVISLIFWLFLYLFMLYISKTSISCPVNIFKIYLTFFKNTVLVDKSSDFLNRRCLLL